MKLYELTYLISSELSEEEAGQQQAKIVSLIQEQGGLLVQEKFPLKKKLAYPVKKEPQAYLATINFQLLPEKLADLEKKIKSENQILRYLMLTKMPPKKMKAFRAPRKRKMEETKSLSPRKPKKEKKVELKEIEKKLEEILQQDDA